MGVTCGAGTTHPSGAPEFTPPPDFSGVRDARSLIFCVFCCRSLFVLLFSFCLLALVLSVLRFTVSDYLFGFFLSFGHCIVRASIYSFWLPLWFLFVFWPLYCPCFDLQFLITSLVSSNFSDCPLIGRFLFWTLINTSFLQ